MQIIIDEQRLELLAGPINEMPTKWGFQLAYYLNLWKEEAQRKEQEQQQPDPEPSQTV